MTYDKKREHERACMHLPCSCSHSGCDFVASYRNLNKHFETNHVGSATRFSYNRDFPITLKKNEKFIVFQERNEGTFILKNRLIEGVENAVRLTFLQPSFLKRESFYELGASTNGGNLRLLSYTKSSPNHVYDGSPSMANFLLIPVDFFRSSDQLRMNLCISPNGDQPPIYWSSILASCLTCIICLCEFIDFFFVQLWNSSPCYWKIVWSSKFRGINSYCMYSEGRHPLVYGYYDAQR